MSSTYPSHWESDVVLLDGGTVHVRPISPDDAEALVEFHSELSPDSIHFRFLGPHPRLSAREVEWFTHVDHDSRVALVAEVDGRLIAVGRYERIPGSEVAEVAFVVADHHQGRGIGTLLLEELAILGREKGISRFVAHVLAGNSRMLRVFHGAGFVPREVSDGGVVRVEFAIEPTDEWRTAVEGREHRAEAQSVARLLRPRSVAIIGASPRPASVGHQVVRNLQAAGFEGQIYPVHPTAKEIRGLPAFASVAAIPGGVDLAVVAVPAAAVVGVAEECAIKGVAGMVVLSAGFGEVGEEGRALQADLRAVVRKHGIRLIGPNCIGIINTALGLDATFSSYRPLQGSVAMQSQSGAVGIALLEFASRIGLGISSFVSVGNKADVSGNDLLQYWEDDPATEVILLYLESFGNPRKFGRLARRISRRKPIIALKSGRTEAGSRAASSHTAAMASSDAAVDALFRQAGVIRVDRLDELFNVATVLAGQPLPAGRRVAIVGNSGGPGVLATDACDAAGLDVVNFSTDTMAALRQVTDPNATLSNPVDLVASATPETYEAVLRVLIDDPNVDAVLTIATPTLFAPAEEVAAAVARAANRFEKPVLATFLAWAGMPALLPALDGGRPVPAFRAPEDAVGALAHAVGYGAWRRRDPGRVPELDRIDVAAARAVASDALVSADEGVWLEPDAAVDFLSSYGIPVAPTTVVGSVEHVSDAADAIGYPVVIKAVAPDLVHKTDVGGVALNIQRGETREAAARIAAAVRDLTGFAIQPMVPTGVELIVGVVQDPLFGPLVMLGMGGVLAELLGDRAFRILPVTDLDAAELVRSLRCSLLLFGYRGSPPTAVDHLEELIVRVGRLAGDLPQLYELDLNPVIVTPERVTVVDAKVHVHEPRLAPPEAFRRLG